jgi:hypothetical protein
MAYQDIRDRLKPCPFCGSINIRIDLGSGGKIVTCCADHADVKCMDCGCQFKHIVLIHEHFEPIKDDIYRKIPTKYAEEVMIEKWNSRVGEVKE